jgi:hypothetical protein
VRVLYVGAGIRETPEKPETREAQFEPARVVLEGLLVALALIDECASLPMADDEAVPRNVSSGLRQLRYEISVAR